MTTFIPRDLNGPAVISVPTAAQTFAAVCVACGVQCAKQCTASGAVSIVQSGIHNTLAIKVGYFVSEVQNYSSDVMGYSLNSIQIHT